MPAWSSLKSSVAPQELMRRVEWSEDCFELRVMWVGEDVGRVEAEPLPPVRLEPIRVFRADQRKHAAWGSRPLEFKHYARIGRNAGARHGQLSPTVHNRECGEKSSAYVGTRASADKNASQPGGWFYTHELTRSAAEVHGEPAAACGHLENPPPIDLELCQDTRMNGLGLADGVPELRFELVYHRPEQSSTEPLSRLCVAAAGRFAFTRGDGSQVLGWQPSSVIEAVALPAGRSGGSGLEVIHF
jgi:hypothetical protein